MCYNRIKEHFIKWPKTSTEIITADSDLSKLSNSQSCQWILSWYKFFVHPIILNTTDCLYQLNQMSLKRFESLCDNKFTESHIKLKPLYPNPSRVKGWTKPQNKTSKNHHPKIFNLLCDCCTCCGNKSHCRRTLSLVIFQKTPKLTYF